MLQNMGKRLTMVSARFLGILGLVSIVLSPVPAPAGQRGAGGHPSAVAVTLEQIYRTAYDEAYSQHITLAQDGTTYVSTGDIQAEWLRDASAVIKPYIGLALTDEDVRQTLRGVIARQAKYILLDPYANAFSLNYKVVERKFEVDSLLYPIWFSYLYWKATGDRSVFTPEVQRAFDRAVDVLRTEQHHQKRSSYRHPQLSNGGTGSAVGYTGLVWTGFRPSDDPGRYQYNIPDNMFAVVVMRDLTDIQKNVYRDNKKAANAWGLGTEIGRAIEQYGQVNLPGFGRIYSYEIDGLGHSNLMDDANLPSLLSIPYFGYVNAHDTVYRATRTFVLCNRNPYFYKGKYAQGIGSPHTPRGYIWPLSLVIQALTATDQSEVDRTLDYIAASDVGDHRLHESFNGDWPEAYTRADFAWPNALFAELMLSRQGHIPTAMKTTDKK
ncbi:MAG: glycoside hydrolase family 125 protein [Candidatus Eremiobacteraeota bacterium]|nr:glycoside hydrolase family 125 protein [Candidatus Eremiobacteraeota bacterium]